jgi:hypothetical protein
MGQQSKNLLSSWDHRHVPPHSAYLLSCGLTKFLPGLTKNHNPLNFRLQSRVYILKQKPYWEWLQTPIIPALWRLGQENHEFETNLSYIVRCCLKIQKQETKQTKKPSEAFNSRRI